MVKAYFVYERNGDRTAAIIFAETSGKAKALARYTDEFEDSEFTDIRVLRKPEIDSYYRGEWYMDWDNPNDRIVMVRYAGFTCGDYAEYSECCKCLAHEWCTEYEAQKKWIEREVDECIGGSIERD